MKADARLVLVHSDEYANWVFDAHHPTQGRRFTKARELLLQLAPEAGIEVEEIEADYFPTREQLERVHTKDYVDDVLIHGRSGEWEGQRHDLGHLAHRMAGGTFLAAKALLDGKATTAVNFAGAKHHAMADRSSGFCVFADFAMVAKHLLATEPRVQRIAILDIDAHHGDGTETLLRDEPRVLTFSIHDRTIFPGTGHTDDEAHQAYNEPLPAYSGDHELAQGAERFIRLAKNQQPDMIFIAIGADGHETDPLSTLQYSIPGMKEAISKVRQAFPEAPLILGGSGGYQPDDVTPSAWVATALSASAWRSSRNLGAESPCSSVMNPSIG
jgi:acetoin utilization protein AcuC